MKHHFLQFSKLIGKIRGISIVFIFTNAVANRVVFFSFFLQARNLNIKFMLESHMTCQGLTTDYWLLTTDYWLLTTDYWLLTTNLAVCHTMYNVTSLTQKSRHTWHVTRHVTGPRTGFLLPNIRTRGAEFLIALIIISVQMFSVHRCGCDRGQH